LVSLKEKEITMKKDSKIIITLILVAILGVAVYAVMTTPDQRSTGEKVGDAIDRLDDGVDDAARELESRTPAERIGDEIKDETNNNN
jgi:hypothetical protein